MNKLIWTPKLYGRCDFGVDLDWDFAREMIQARVPEEKQARMNALANEELKTLRTNWLDPYSFHEGSCFVKQIYLGQNGIWLSTNHQTIVHLIKGDKSEPVRYNSHNVDTSHQAYVLMVLFDKWINYSDAFKG